MKVDTSGTAASCKLQKWLHVTARLQMGSLRCKTSPHLVIHQTAPHHTAEHILSSSIPQITQYDSAGHTGLSCVVIPEGIVPPHAAVHADETCCLVTKFITPLKRETILLWNCPRSAVTRGLGLGTRPPPLCLAVMPRPLVRFARRYTSPKRDLRHRFRVPKTPDASSTNNGGEDKYFPPSCMVFQSITIGTA